MTTSPWMPRSVAMARAVAAWSPVIIFTLTPARRQRAMASAASGRGGSTRPTSAVIRRSSTRARGSGAAATSASVSGLVASAMTRMPARGHPVDLRAPSRRASASLEDGQRSSRTSGAPFTSRRSSASDAVDGGHELVGRVEGHLGHPVGLDPHRGGVEPALGGEDQQRRLHRVTDGAPVDEVAVVAAHQAGEHVGQADAAGGLDLAALLVAPAGDLVPAVRQPELLHRHLVQGQGAGLVRADDRGGPEGLDRGQALDDGAPLGHLGGADGEGHGHHGGQALGDGRHRQGDRRQHGVGQGLAPQQAEGGEDRPRRPPRPGPAADRGRAAAPAAGCPPPRPRRAGRRCARPRCPCPWWSRATSPRPRVTTVFMKTRFVRSASGRSPARASVVLATGVDSPVRVDSSTSMPGPPRIRPSAGTRSPASSSTTSPGTRSTASTSTTRPWRRTRARATSIAFSAARLRSARTSWRKPSRALMTRTTPMTTMSLTSPTSPASTAAPMSTTISRLRNWSNRIAQRDGRGLGQPVGAVHPPPALDLVGAEAHRRVDAERVGHPGALEQVRRDRGDSRRRAISCGRRSAWSGAWVLRLGSGRRSLPPLGATRPGAMPR